MSRMKMIKEIHKKYSQDDKYGDFQVENLIYFIYGTCAVHSRLITREK